MLPACYAFSFSMGNPNRRRSAATNCRSIFCENSPKKENPRRQAGYKETGF